MPLPLSYLNRIKQGENPADFLTAGCLQPKRITVYDSLTSTWRDMYVDCGHCINCQNAARNQWVTRMCLHSLSWAHCYFVTLTYGSYNLNLYETHPFKKDWQETYPVEDSYNTFHEPRWTPSILHKGHLAKFFKRLRVNTDATITYCACGEYGEKYGRPHFHAVIWSDKALTLDDFKHAWSYKCVWKDKYNVARYTGKEDSFFYFRLGQVKMYDLVANGTLDWKAEYSGSKDSASHCFQYVAKYVHKGVQMNEIVERRLWNVFIQQPYDMNYLGNDEEERKKQIFMEKMMLGKKTANYIEESDSYLFHTFNHNNLFYEKINFTDFRKILRPFFLCSRGRAIAKEYALDNLSRFSQGNYSLPKFQGRQLAFPDYFARMASLVQNPLRLRKIGTVNNSLVKGSYENVYSYYHALRDDSSVFYTLSSYVRHSQLLRFDPWRKSTITSSPINGSLIDISAIDLKLGIINYYYNPHDDIFEGYRFNKHIKEYEFVEYCNREEFCDWVCDTMQRQFETKDRILDSRQKKLELYELLENVDDTTREQKIQTEFALFDDKQSRYTAEHASRCDNQ